MGKIIVSLRWKKIFECSFPWIPVFLRWKKTHEDLIGPNSPRFPQSSPCNIVMGDLQIAKKCSDGLEIASTWSFERCSCKWNHDVKRSASLTNDDGLHRSEMCPKNHDLKTLHSQCMGELLRRWFLGHISAWSSRLSLVSSDPTLEFRELARFRHRKLYYWLYTL